MQGLRPARRSLAKVRCSRLSMTTFGRASAASTLLAPCSSSVALFVRRKTRVKENLRAKYDSLPNRSRSVGSLRPPSSTILAPSLVSPELSSATTFATTRASSCSHARPLRRRIGASFTKVPGVFDEVPSAARTKSSLKGGAGRFPPGSGVGHARRHFRLYDLAPSLRTANVFAPREFGSPDSRDGRPLDRFGLSNGETVLSLPTSGARSKKPTLTLRRAEPTSPFRLAFAKRCRIFRHFHLSLATNQISFPSPDSQANR